MLAQAVERLATQRREELHLPLKAVLHLLGDGRSAFRAKFAFGHREVPELLAGLLVRTVVDFAKQRLVLTIEELYAPCLLAHLGLYVLSLHHHTGRHHQVTRFSGQLLNGYRAFVLRLRHNHQALRLHGQLILRCGPHTDNVIVHHLELNHPSLSARRTNGHLLPVFHNGFLSRCHKPATHHRQHQQAKTSHCFHHE